MENGKRNDSATEPGFDEALRAAFESTTGGSVLERIQRLTGVTPGVMIHDDLDEPSPLLRVKGLESDPAEDDSRYQVVGEIARGGVGVVHKARDRDLGRDVALKVLRSEFSDNSEVFARFIEEAQIGGQLQHPGIVPVYGMGLQTDGRPSFAMKLIKGKTLAAALRERESPAEDRRRFLAIFEQTAQTVGYAHSRGVIHRDLKPSNILVGNFGEVQVVDWGFGKVLGRPEPEEPETTIVATVRSTGEGSNSMAGSVMGTPPYMPPEQALGKVDEMDEQSDVFALGSILTEILTGRPAYAGDSRDLHAMAAQANLDDAFERLDACEAEPAMRDLAKRCLAPLRKDRPRDATAVAREVGEHLSAAEERARIAEIKAVEGRARLERETKRAAWERKARRKVLALAACVLMAMLAGGISWLTHAAGARSRAEAARPAVEQAVEEASLLAGQAKWSEALAAARKGIALAEEADDETKRSAAAALADAEAGLADANAEAEQVRKDEALLARLREIPTRWGEGGFMTDVPERDPAFVAAFEKWGIALDRANPADAGERIRARGPDFASEVAAALDDLVWLRRELLQQEDGAWKPLVAMADTAAPDETHTRLRRSVLDRDRESLLRLGSSEEVLDLPSRSQRLLGFGLWTVGEPRESASFLRRALRVHPDDLSILLLFGEIQCSSEPAEAVRCFTAALALRPESVNARLGLGKALLWDGRHEDAIAVWRDALLRAPQNVVLLTSITHAYRAAGDGEGALAAAREAMRTAPDSYWVHHHSGRVFADEWMDEERREAFEATLHTAQELTALANSLTSRGRLADAFEIIQRAVALEPTNARARYRFGRVQLGRGRLDEAIEALRETLRLGLGDDSAFVHQKLAVAYLMKGHLDEALAAHGQGIRLSPWDPPLHLTLSGSLSTIGRLEDALRAARRVIRLKPNSSSGYRHLGSLLRRMGRLEEAIEAIQHAIRLGAENPDAHFDLAHCLMRDGRPAEAERAYREVTRLQPNHALAHCYLGAALENLGRFEDALTSRRKGHELGTRHRDWPHPSERWVARAVGKVEFEKELPRILDGEGLPSKPHDLKLLAAVCSAKGLHEEAARFWRDAVSHPDMADWFGAAPPVAAVRAGWHEQALVWMREQLERARIRAETDPTTTRETLVRWLGNRGFSAVRDAGSMAQLAPDERDAWSACWTELAALIEELKPDRAIAHYNLGRSLRTQKHFEGAVTALRTAVEEKPDWAEAHRLLSRALSATDRHEAAIAAARAALRLEPKNHHFVNTLGVALIWADRAAEAVEVYRLARRTDPDFGYLHNAGLAFHENGEPERAVELLREVVQKVPFDGTSRFSLGVWLLECGAFSRALTHVRGSKELGGAPGNWLRLCERFVELEPKLPAVLSGEGSPGDPGERADLAWLCYYQRRFAASARLFREAFGDDPALADDVLSARRLYAASAAARAGCGQGVSPPTGSREKAAWHEQAREWLRADLAYIRSQPWERRGGTATTLRHYLFTVNLAPVRKPGGLAVLPDPEREAWTVFWQEARETLEAVKRGK